MSVEQTTNERLDALERRMIAIETQAKRIDQIASQVDRIATLLDGRDDLGVSGLRKQLAANSDAIAKLVKVEEARGIQLDTIEKMLRFVSTVFPIPLALGVVQFISGLIK